MGSVAESSKKENGGWWRKETHQRRSAVKYKTGSDRAGWEKEHDRGKTALGRFTDGWMDGWMDDCREMQKKKLPSTFSLTTPLYFYVHSLTHSLTLLPLNNPFSPLIHHSLSTANTLCDNPPPLGGARQVTAN